MASLIELKDHVNKLIETLGGQAPVAYALWLAEDVKTECAHVEGADIITDDNIVGLLNYIHFDQDCSVGITWDIIRRAIQHEVNYQNNRGINPIIETI